MHSNPKKNFISSWVSIVINTFIIFIYTPFLVKNLGIEVYGLIPLFASIVGLLSFTTSGLNAILFRDMTKYIHGESDNTKAIELLSSVLTIYSVIIFLYTIFFMITSVHIGSIFNLPNISLDSTRFYYYILYFSFLMTSVSSVLSSKFYANNSNYIPNYGGLTVKIIGILFILSISYLYKLDIEWIAIGLLIESVIYVLYIIYNWMKMPPLLSINKIRFTKNNVKYILLTSYKSSVIEIGNLLQMSTILLISNHLYGAKISGIYAIVLVVYNAFLLAGDTITKTVAPIYNRLHVKKQGNNTIQSVMLFSYRVSTAVLFIPAIVFIVYSEEVLYAWVGEEISEHFALLSVLMLPVVFNIPARTVIPVQMVLDKLDIPGFVSISIGLLMIVIPFVYNVYFPGNYFGVAFSFIVTLTVRNSLFNLYYSVRISGISSKKIILYQAMLLFYFILSILLIFFVKNYFEMHFVINALALIFIFMLVFRFLLNNNDREIIKSLFIR